MPDDKIVSGIARYGLGENPYRPKPLDPLRSPRDAELLTRVSGLEEASAYVDRAVDARETAFVLIAGRRGAGRTSVCNHLLAHYRDRRNVALDKFIVPRREFSGKDDHFIWRNWLRSLHHEARRTKLTPLQDGNLNVDEDLRSGETLKDRDTYTTDADYLMQSVSEVLEAKGAGFAVCLENIDSYDVVSSGLTIFGQARTLVVVTVLDYADTRGSIIANFKLRQREAASAAGPPHLIELEQVRGESAGTLVQRRWDVARPQCASPFERAELPQAFDDKLRPAGAVMRITAEALDWKVKTTGEGPVWPKAQELAFGAQELRGMVAQIEHLLEAGRP